MRCVLSPVQDLSVRQALELVGGATESIFPQAEALLLSGDDYVSALEYAVGKRERRKYHSMMDMLFCQLHPEYQPACSRFYISGEKPLREVLSIEEVVEFGNRLVVALHVARGCVVEKRRSDWETFRLDVEEAVFLSA